MKVTVTCGFYCTALDSPDLIVLSEGQPEITYPPTYWLYRPTQVVTWNNELD